MPASSRAGTATSCAGRLPGCARRRRRRRSRRHAGCTRFYGRSATTRPRCAGCCTRPSGSMGRGGSRPDVVSRRRRRAAEAVRGGEGAPEGPTAARRSRRGRCRRLRRTSLCARLWHRVAGRPRSCGCGRRTRGCSDGAGVAAAGRDAGGGACEAACDPGGAVEGVGAEEREAGAAGYRPPARPAVWRSRPRPHVAAWRNASRSSAGRCRRCSGCGKPYAGRRPWSRSPCDPPPTLAPVLRVRLVAGGGLGAASAAAVDKTPYGTSVWSRVLYSATRACFARRRLAGRPGAAGLVGDTGRQRAPLRAAVRAGCRGDPRAPGRGGAAPRRRDHVACRRYAGRATRAGPGCGSRSATTRCASTSTRAVAPRRRRS